MRKIFCFLLLSCIPALGLKAQERTVIRSADSTVIYSLIRKADTLFMQFPDSAAQHYYRAFSFSKLADDHKGIVHCATKLGSYYFNTKRDYIGSQRVLKEALPYLKKLDKKNVSFIPLLYNLLGNAYYRTGANDSAIFCYTQAINSLDSFAIHKPQLRIQLYGNMGAVLAASGQYRQGAQYMKTALHSKEIGSSEKARNYHNLGSLYSNYLGNMDSALYWWQQAVVVYRGLQDTANLQDLYANMGVGWTDITHLDIDKAKQYLDTAIQFGIYNAESNVLVQQGLSTVFYYRQQYGLCISHALRMLDICERRGNRERKLLAYWLLTYGYAHINNAEKTHEFQLKRALLNDSIWDEQITLSISELETKYRFSEKNKELAEKNKILAENQAALYRQRFWLAGSIGGGLVLLLSLMGFIRSSRQKRRLHREQLQSLQQQQKIAQLQVKVSAEEEERRRIARELHDGIGVLLSAAKIHHTLLGKALPEAGKDTIAYNESEQILLQMQQEIKTITHNLVPDYITHKSFEETLETLTARFNRPGAFEIQLQVYGAVQDMHPDRSFSLYRAMEEIIHNAVKHSGATELIIQLMYHPDQLHINIEDNGRGFDAGNIYPGMGLQNIRSRIALLGGYLNFSSEIELGTTYTLEIPYKKPAEHAEADNTN